MKAMVSFFRHLFAVNAAKRLKGTANIAKLSIVKALPFKQSLIFFV